MDSGLMPLDGRVLFVNCDMVNLDDLVRWWDGGIVRVYGNPADSVMFSPLNNESVDRLAGLISEDV